MCVMQDYDFEIVSVTSLGGTASVPSYVITGLLPGVTYYARVSSMNAVGFSLYSPTTTAGCCTFIAPALPPACCGLSFVPKQIPGAPLDVNGLSSAVVEPYTGNSLLVRFDETADASGDVITKYRVETDTYESIIVNSSDYAVFELPVTHRIQKVVVDAHFQPLSGVFAMSFGGFHGDLIRRVTTTGSLVALFSVSTGGSVATTVTGNVNTVVFPGDYFKIGGETFRVCLGSTITNAVPLCSVADPTASTTFTGVAPDPNLTGQPAYVPDTTIGVGSIATGQSVVTTAVDARSYFSCGDEIQIGDTDQLYRTSVALCGSNTAAAIHLDRALRGVSVTTMPVWRRQTTVDLKWDCTAQEMKTALEALTLVSTVDVDRRVHGNGYEWTVTFTTVRGNALLNGGALSAMAVNARTLTSSNPALHVAYATVYGANEFVVPNLRAGIPYYFAVRYGVAIHSLTHSFAHRLLVRPQVAT
jgi:hypothetical protein